MTGFFNKTNTAAARKHTKDLGDNFYLEYEFVSNLMGGYHPVNICLKNTQDDQCNVQITDGLGNFKRFPGARKGPWQKELDGPFYAAIQFSFSVSKFVDGICYVAWTVQPDGRYFADEDGFGAEDFSEIQLYSKMNTAGEFICPFTEEYFEGCKQCYCL